MLDKHHGWRLAVTGLAGAAFASEDGRKYSRRGREAPVGPPRRRLRTLAFRARRRWHAAPGAAARVVEPEDPCAGIIAAGQESGLENDGQRRRRSAGSGDHFESAGPE